MFVSGVLLSLAGAALTRHSHQQRTAIRFASEVAMALNSLTEHVRAYGEVLTGVQGLTHASGGLNQRLLHDYLTSMAFQQQRRGILGVTFGVPLQQAQRQAFEARMRKESGPQNPFTILPAGERPDYFVVTYGEPYDENASVFGYDTLTIPGQRSSVDLAIDTGRLVSTVPLKVKQYDGPDPCLVLRLAIYDPKLPAATPEQRRRAVYGVINTVFRAQDLIHSALDQETLKRMDVWIVDIGEALAGTPSEPKLVFGNPLQPQSRWPKPWLSQPRARKTLTVGGRAWQIDFLANPDLTDNLAWLLPLGVLAAGFAVTGLLAGLLTALNQTEQRARHMALRMTEQLQENEARLKAIAQAVPDLLFVLDEDGHYVEVYGAQEQLLAAPKPELIGRTVQEMLPPDLAQSVMAGLGDALATHQLQTMSYSLKTEAGLIHFEARLYAMGTRINGQRCVVVMARDITERSRAEENLRMTQKLESLGVLAGGIAHDFNNLLTAILGNLNLAQTCLEAEAKAAPYLQRVETTVLRAADLAHQMLAYSGRGTFTVAPLDLNHVVGEMTELLSVSISKKAALRFDLTPSLAPILADAAQIQQVVMNLVTNASESLEDRNGTIAIATGTRFLDQAYLETNLPTQQLAPGHYVILTVTDTGCGMDQATLTRIFDPFFTTKSTGRGLGLSAMLGILRGHGAGIKITSQPGAGSTFRLLFPAALPLAQARPTDLPHPKPDGQLRGTVLVVDDEPMLRATVASILETLGLHAIQAADGVEALDLHSLYGHTIDLILMDITMPRMDGNQAFLALRERDPELPVILCSGFTIQEMVSPPPGMRPAAFVQKPYRIEDLEKALQTALQDRIQLKEPQA